MRSLVWLFVAAAIALAAPALAACGVDSKAKTGKLSTPAAAATDTAGGSPEISQIERKFRDASFKATYKVTPTENSDQGGAADLIGNVSTIILYKGGEDRLRLDLKGNANGKELEIIQLQTKDGAYSCTRNAVALGAIFGATTGDDSNGLCHKEEPNRDQTPFLNFADFLDPSAVIVSRSERDIIGRHGVCFTTKGANASGTSDTCLTKDGVLLYQRSSDTGTVEATAIGSVNDNDFKPPYHVTLTPLAGGGDATP